MRTFRTLIPVIWSFRTALLLLLLGGLLLWVNLNPPVSNFAAREIKEGFLAGGGLAVVVTLLDLYLQRSYRICYDASTVFWRKVGFRGRFASTVAMPFEAITDVTAARGSLGIKPFEAAILRSSTHDVPEILLSRLYLESYDIRELLLEVATRSPATFDDLTSEFISN